MRSVTGKLDFCGFRDSPRGNRDRARTVVACHARGQGMPMRGPPASGKRPRQAPGAGAVPAAG
eukprot:930587-Pyramimonas_sp.AAC.1